MNLSDETAGARLGEVVEASSTEFAVHCYRLYESAPLGALVRTGGDSPVFGVVHEIATASIDPGRQTVAMGGDADTVEGVYESNPQLNRLYSTRFRTLMVGFRENGHVRRYLAPVPAKIHDHVYRCGDDEVLDFCASLEFLPTLLAAPTASGDEVVACFLRRASTAQPAADEFLVTAGQELATLLSGQLQRLNTLLRRIALE